ncbi:MAG: Tudor-knot domain-containing protein [Planctomycetota bacterium]
MNSHAQDPPAQPAGGPKWDPASTWVFAVGVIEFKGEMSGWPQEGRKDAELVALLMSRGVAADHVVYLQDKDATRASIDAKFAEFLPKPGEADTLIVYFTGHGSRGDAGDTCFTPYDFDSDKRAETGWDVAGVFDSINKSFKGKRAWVIADCCYSGSIVETAKKHRRDRVNYACFASSSASTTSTGNWTFTECVIGAFKGDPRYDLNNDGVVRMREAAEFTTNEMAFIEGQLSTFGATGFPDLALAARNGERNEALARRIECESEGKWYLAQILGTREGEIHVHYVGWDAKWDEWVKTERVRDWAPVTHPAGTAVEVRWHGKWYAAKVLESKLGLHLITYADYGSNWDEWVGPTRIRLPGSGNEEDDEEGK